MRIKKKAKDVRKTRDEKHTEIVGEIREFAKTGDMSVIKKYEPDEKFALGEQCREAAECIRGAFVWAKTKEGHEYWADVVANLERYALVNDMFEKEDV